jgi:rubrerythrin
MRFILKILQILIILVQTEVNKNRQTMEQSEAIEAAIKSCVERKILVYFLEKHASEVLNMLFTEWNLDDALEETAKSMLKEGLDVVLIERITKLPQEEILALR